MWQRKQQFKWGKCDDGCVRGQGKLRREEDAEGQRVDGPSQRDDSLRQCVRTGLPGSDLELHSQWFGRWGDRIYRQPNRFRWVGLAVGAERVRRRAAALRLAGVEPAGGV